MIKNILVTLAVLWVCGCGSVEQLYQKDLHDIFPKLCQALNTPDQPPIPRLKPVPDSEWVAYLWQEISPLPPPPGLVAFYWRAENTIVFSMAAYHPTVMAHEIAHVILEHGFCCERATEEAIAISMGENLEHPGLLAKMGARAGPYAKAVR